MEDGNFEAQSQSFLTWFKSLPGSTFDDNLSLADLRFRNAGRGIGEILSPVLQRGDKYVMWSDG